VESVSRLNIVKKIKIDGDWKLLSIPRNAKGNYDWNALPDGLYLIEWRAGGKRRRESAGVTAAQALEAQRRKRHELEGRKLGVAGFELAGETPKIPALHVGVRNYSRKSRRSKSPTRTASMKPYSSASSSSSATKNRLTRSVPTI
jgi:hypothetical protein